MGSRYRLHRQPIRKRLISLHLHSGNFSESKKLVVSDSAGGARSPQSKLSRSKGVTMLVEYLDCFYNDLEGWAELASVYASMGLCVILSRLKIMLRLIDMHRSDTLNL